MTHLVRVASASVLAAVAMLLMGAGVAHAIGDHTLPFYDPGVSLSYGVDRDPRPGVQLDWTGKTWNDGAPHWGRVYDNHTGSDYPMVLRSHVAAARGGMVVDLEGGFGTEEFGNFGNFVQVRNADGRHTLYYHLASAADGGIVVALNQGVMAGQWVGLSGCSGLCFGPHLHFEVLIEKGQNLVWTDPLSGRAYTTWPPRVPFLATYVRESNAGTEVIQRGRTVTHWVEFRNVGGRTWRNNGIPSRIVLATWDPAKHASPFRAPDWPSSWLATPLDQVAVAPDGTGRFTFQLRGGVPPGSYRETFNLLADGLRWFDHERLGGFYVPIVVTNLTE
jgi:murein DD-endopeptidase MepM/ murein hydrolase activator NlpD